MGVRYITDTSLTTGFAEESVNNLKMFSVGSRPLDLEIALIVTPEDVCILMQLNILDV